MNSRFFRNSVIYVLMVVATAAIAFAFFRPSGNPQPTEDLSRVIADARAGRIERIEVTGDILKVKLADGTAYTSRKESVESVLQVLQRAGVQDISQISIEVTDPNRFRSFTDLTLQFIPTLVIIGLILVAALKLKASAQPTPRP
jgi:cell division protease FtsH